MGNIWIVPLLHSVSDVESRLGSESTTTKYPRNVLIIIIIIIIIIINASTITGKHEVNEQQKTAILGTAYKLRKVLM
jgi:hypothetical protein